MEEYHKNWLKESKQSYEWFKSALDNGFDIHHVDGNHSNNNPNNLILVYTGDHMMLHTGVKSIKRLFPKVWESTEDYHKNKMEIGEKAYNLKTNFNTWKNVANELGLDYPTVYNAARNYAEWNNLKWFKLKKPNKSNIKAKYLKDQSLF